MNGEMSNGMLFQSNRNNKISSCICYAGCGIITSAKRSWREWQRAQKKRTPGELHSLRGSFLGLLPFFAPVKPLANVVSNYTCHNRHHEAEKYRQRTHLLPVASLEKAAKPVYCIPAETASQRRTRSGGSESGEMSNGKTVRRTRLTCPPDCHPRPPAGFPGPRGWPQ